MFIFYNYIFLFLYTSFLNKFILFLPVFTVLLSNKAFLVSFLFCIYASLVFCTLFHLGVCLLVLLLSSF